MLEFAYKLDVCVHWLRIAQTVLCLGLNLLIPLMRRHPRLAKLAIAVIVINEIRGAVLAWEGFKAVFL